jgi:hypothetical protein
MVIEDRVINLRQNYKSTKRAHAKPREKDLRVLSRRALRGQYSTGQQDKTEHVLHFSIGKDIALRRNTFWPIQAAGKSVKESL